MCLHSRAPAAPQLPSQSLTPTQCSPLLLNYLCHLNNVLSLILDLFHFFPSSFTCSFLFTSSPFLCIPLLFPFLHLCLAFLTFLWCQKPCFCFLTFHRLHKAHWRSSSVGSYRNQTVWDTLGEGARSPFKSGPCLPFSLMQDVTSLHQRASYSSCTISISGTS